MLQVKLSVLFPLSGTVLLGVCLVMLIMAQFFHHSILRQSVRRMSFDKCARSTSLFPSYGNFVLHYKLQTGCATYATNTANFTSMCVLTNKNNLSFFITPNRQVALPPQRKKSSPTGSPINWQTVGITVAVGIIVIFAMKFYKDMKEKKLDAETIQSYGKPILGGDFELVDQNGEIISNKDFIGQWVLIYFGFTHCPDICPEELEKMASIVETVNRNTYVPDLQPVFISIDPERDSPEEVKKYILDFHPDMIGLTGTREQVDAASRAFRVYYSEGPKDKDDDYLVDHTVIMYLLDNRGEFSEYFGQNKSAGEVASTITAVMLKSKTNVNK